MVLQWPPPLETGWLERPALTIELQAHVYERTVSRFEWLCSDNHFGLELQRPFLLSVTPL